MTECVLVDVSFLLRRRPLTPCGVERVQMAYIMHFQEGSRTAGFVATSWRGHLSLLPASLARNIALTYGRLWDGGKFPLMQKFWLSFLCLSANVAILIFGRTHLKSTLAASQPPVYISVGFVNLDDAAACERIKRVTGAKVILFVHDIDPIVHPHLFPPGRNEICARRMRNIANSANAIIVATATTAANFRSFLGKSDHLPPIFIDHLAGGLRKTALIEKKQCAHQSYFVCIGTIEPRKNCRMLLDVWRGLARERGRNAPQLVLIGRRGWDETYVAAVSRDIETVGFDLVHRYENLSDADVRRLLQGACALLMPTLAEGYGLPLVEALDCNVPALVSNLAVLQEVGGDVPYYLDPTDRAAWKAAIMDYCDEPSFRRNGQLSRIAGRRASNWAEHFHVLDRAIADCQGTISQTSPLPAEVQPSVQGLETESPDLRHPDCQFASKDAASLECAPSGVRL